MMKAILDLLSKVFAGIDPFFLILIQLRNFQVFEVEKIATKAGLMHKHCLSCNECKSNLDASTFYNGFDGEVYCKYCYAVKFGHKQKSNYKGWMDVKAIPGEKGDRATCPRCLGKVSASFFDLFLQICFEIVKIFFTVLYLTFVIRILHIKSKDRHRCFIRMPFSKFLYSNISCS